MAKFIPNWNCHYRVSQQTELTQSKTPPTVITDSIILSKGNMEHKLRNAKEQSIVQITTTFIHSLPWSNYIENTGTRHDCSGVSTLNTTSLRTVFYFQGFLPVTRSTLDHHLSRFVFLFLYYSLSIGTIPTKKPRRLKSFPWDALV